MSKVEVIAHRGLCYEAPENTTFSIQSALELEGLGGVEFDVELSRSDEPVVLHQETLVPNVNFSALEAAERDYINRDWVAEYLASDITQLDSGSWFERRFSHLRVPRLFEVLQCDWRDKQAYMELKDPTYWRAPDPARPARIVASVLPDVKQFNGKLKIFSFNPEILRESAKQLPEVPRVLALWTEWQRWQQEAIEVAKAVEASVISLADRMILEDWHWLDKAQSAALEVHVYPVSPTRYETEFQSWTPYTCRAVWDELIKMGVNGIISDFPRELLAHLVDMGLG